MAETNGRLDISKLVDWDGHQNYLTREAALQWIALRIAYFALTGVWLFTSECYRPVGEEGDYARGRINTQWYWYEYYDRDTRMAAYPGSTSSHGWALAMDLVSWPERMQLVALAAAYGFDFPFDYEPWHMQYVGNPTTLASLGPTPFEIEENELNDAEKKQLADTAWLVAQMKGQMDDLTLGRGLLHKKLDDLLWLVNDKREGLRYMVAAALAKFGK